METLRAEIRQVDARILRFQKSLSGALRVEAGGHRYGGTARWRGSFFPSSDGLQHGLRLARPPGPGRHGSSLELANARKKRCPLVFLRLFFCYY